jgi:hypothetical protein
MASANYATSDTTNCHTLASMGNSSTTIVVEHTPSRPTIPVAPDAPRRREWEVLYDRRDGSWTQVAGETEPTDSLVRNLMASFDRMGDPLVSHSSHLPLLDSSDPFTYNIVDRDGDFFEVITDRLGRIVFEGYCGKVDTDPSAQFDIQEKVEKKPEGNDYYFDFGFLADEDGNQLTLTGQRVRRHWTLDACCVIRNLCGRYAWERHNKIELPPYIHERSSLSFDQPFFRQKTCAGKSSVLQGNTGDMCPTGTRSPGQKQCQTLFYYNTEYVLLPMGLTQSERCQALELGFYPWLKRMTDHAGNTDAAVAADATDATDAAVATDDADAADAAVASDAADASDAAVATDAADAADAAVAADASDAADAAVAADDAERVRKIIDDFLAWREKLPKKSE